MGCPHENVIFCPLYHEMHNGRGLSCDDGNLDQGGCAVERGLSYSETVGKIMAVDAKAVAQLRWNEEQASRSGQRLRNMKAAGVH